MCVCVYSMCVLYVCTVYVCSVCVCMCLCVYVCMSVCIRVYGVNVFYVYVYVRLILLLWGNDLRLHHIFVRYTVNHLTIFVVGECVTIFVVLHLRRLRFRRVERK